MPLKFSNDPARYNPYTDVVTFFAMDGGVMIMCNVTRESLEYLQDLPRLPERELVAAFSRHRDQIQRLAAARYDMERQLLCALTKLDFLGNGRG